MTKQNTSGRFFNRLLKGLCIVSAVCISGLSVAVDTDNDGLPDDWEIANGRDPLVADYMVDLYGDETCALVDTGVVCWGNGSSWTQSLNNPKKLSDGSSGTQSLNNPKKLSNSCVVNDTGAVCWGNEMYSVEEPTPKLVNPIAVTQNFRARCAIYESGLKCWGSARWASDYPIYSDFTLSNPSQLAEMSSDGGGGMCVLDDAGVGCGPVVYNEGSDDKYIDFPLVSGLSNPTQLSRSGGFPCALDDTGVVCWGSNTYGRATVPALSNPTQVSSGWHTCAVDDTGVVCWGRNDHGQSDAPTLSNPSQVSVTQTRTCALSDTGVDCWGGYAGQMQSVPNLLIDPDGDGYTNQGGADAFPLDASEWLDTDLDGIGNNADTDDDNDGVSDIQEAIVGTNPLFAQTTMVSAGEYHTCAIDVIGVTCWGLNDSGQTDVPALSNPTQVIAGSYNTCALDDSGLICWGLNDGGETTVPDTLFNTVQVVAGRAHTCALNIAVPVGGVTCWPSSHVYGASKVPGTLSNATRISAGRYHTCALDDNGVTCWGFNYSGQTTVPDTLSNPTQVSAGRYNTCAVDDNGVTCWGSNSNGQTDVPDTLSNPTQVSAGRYHICALDDNGVTCWGSNSNGQTDVPALSNPTQVSAGRDFTCAVDDSGVTCWGSNGNGQATVPDLLNDADGDGYSGGADAFPLDASEWLDTDSDGVGNNADTDDDGDTVLDVDDAFPLDPTRWVVGENSELGANIHVSGDDSYEIYLNGQLVGSDNGWQIAENYAVSLRNGKNVIAIKGINDANGTHPGAFIVSLITNGTEALHTDSTWLLSRQYKENWQSLDGSLESASPATEWGGIESSPWWDTSTEQDASNFPMTSSAKWIWSDGLETHPTVYVRKEFYSTDLLNSDTDGDGVNDQDDAFPLDATESVDTDSDGIGNNADTDDDNDGVLDVNDTFPLDAGESIDTDGDGIGNNTDTDDDNDSVLDSYDALPLDATESVDTDSDGIGNNADTDDDNDGIGDNSELGADFYSESANIHVSGDDSYEIYLNGQLVGSDNGWQLAENYAVSLRNGKNVIAIKGINDADGTHPGAFIVSLTTNGTEALYTDSGWLLSRQYKDNWQSLDGSLESASPATEWGGIESSPWWDTSTEQDASNFPMTSSAKWIWSDGLETHPTVYVRKEFYFTDPLNSDSDSDGYSDLEEINSNSDPLDANSIPLKGLPIWLLKAAKDKMEQDSTN